MIITVAGLHGMFGETTASRLVCPADWSRQGVGERDADRPVLRPDHQVDVGNVVQVAAFNHQGFADVHDGHGTLRAWEWVICGPTA